MTSKSLKLFSLMMAVLFSLFISHGAFADEHEGEEDQTEETSAFQNPTQAMRAVNLAEAYAEKPDPELEKAMDDLNQADQDLQKAIADGEDEDTITELEGIRDEADDKVKDLIAENGDVTAEDIGEMREEGMGWGEIAHELGLHPSVLGMKHAKAYKEQERERRSKGYGPGGQVDDDEIKDATARNYKYGYSKGHGADADDGDSSGNSGSKAKGAGKSKGGSNSNKGGNGNGNGGGNGNGNGKNK